ncbi:hypothetical protein BpHYR1_016204 [Brachionus plicatilis]|uniref:Uncharacterized protein n=1 Tax=Brachionus plicatilis TaxID=10195 RepID=A0A3M7R2L3_BRAPC|nr:hypothetical protein BpHYR1_016204 [Brachionus plicatilis]
MIWTLALQIGYFKNDRVLMVATKNQFAKLFFLFSSTYLWKLKTLDTVWLVRCSAADGKKKISNYLIVF